MNGYLVVGPEGSGTRLFTKILVKAGCDGDYNHKQRFDVSSTSEQYLSKCSLPSPDKPIVLRRSLPHGSHWCDIKELNKCFDHFGYTPYLIIITRDWFSISNSQLTRQRVNTLEMAHHRIKYAYQLIFNGIDYGQKFYIANYENIIYNQKSINEFLKLIELNKLNDDIINELNIKDENRKYYDN